MYNLTFSSYVFILLVLSFFLLIHLTSISSLTLIQGFDVVIELICLILLLIEFIVSFVGGHCSIAAFLWGLLLGDCMVIYIIKVLLTICRFLVLFGQKVHTTNPNTVSNSRSSIVAGIS